MQTIAGRAKELKEKFMKTHLPSRFPRANKGEWRCYEMVLTFLDFERRQESLCEEAWQVNPLIF